MTKSLKNKQTEIMEKAKIIDSMTDGLWVLDTDGNTVDVNHTIEGLFGYSKEELLKINPLQVMAKQDLPKTLGLIKDAFEKGSAVGELNGVRKDGKEIPLWISASIIKDLTGKATGQFAIFRDMSKIKKAQEEIKLFYAAVNSAAVGIAISDLNGKNTYVNPAFERMWGYSNKEATVMTIPEFLPKEEAGRVMNDVMPLCKREGGWAGEIRGKRKNGTIFPISLSASLIKGEKGKPVAMVASFIDITQHKKEDEEIKRSYKKLKELDLAKTEFIAITSHELRSPMTPMKAQLQMLSEGYFGKLNKKQADAVDMVVRNTGHLDHIIMDFLEISRIQAARLKFYFKKTNLEPHIKRIVKEMNDYLPEKKIVIKTNIEKLPKFKVDPDRVLQVLRNLLNNAKKFSKENSTIILTTKVEKDRLLFSIKDSGIGIAEESQPRIFEPFFQEEQTIYRKYGGTGLGLAICKGIIESQNGRIWFKSSLGKGTTFYFTVPFKPAKSSPL
ncbi:PAS domain-containing sensor histidine kinase [archaeon]|nr:PAS domain-containing sensor histidine kinase [archaeon]